MQGLRQFGTAILTSLISVALVIGGLSLALSENMARTPNPGGDIASIDLTTTALFAIVSPGPDGILPTVTPTPAGATSIAPFTPTNASGAPTSAGTTGACGAPFGWVKNYSVQPGDTLFRIALNYSTTTASLQQANCKGSSTGISVGELLWVPNVAPRTPGVTVIPTFPTSTAVPTDPLTETALPFTASPSPTGTPSPTQTSNPTVTPFTPDP